MPTEFKSFNELSRVYFDVKMFYQKLLFDVDKRKNAKL